MQERMPGIEAEGSQNTYDALIHDIDERDRSRDIRVDEQNAEIDRIDQESDERHRQLEKELGHSIPMTPHSPHIPHSPHTPHPPRLR